ncbi:hypothetical protein Dcar01_00839 [Deinococcus carri]|uniref:Uncharacterized protein n=1 Tax=Deinococcus carri TaxID=1211323 RepID=A0ABP9W5P4_9DEIO
MKGHPYWLALALAGVALAGGGAWGGVTLRNGGTRSVEVATCAATHCTGWQRLEPGQTWRVPLAPVRGALSLSISQRAGQTTDFILYDVRLPLRLLLDGQGRLREVRP